MSIPEIIGYIGALFIGLVMGLTGSGGSILSIPILAYLFHLDEKTATAYSLFIVGFTALFGGIRGVYEKLVSAKAVVFLGIPAVLGVLLVRRVLVPVLPDVLFHIGSFDFTRRMLMFGLFSILMFIAAYTMLNKSKVNLANRTNQEFVFHPLIVTEGFFLGIFMGLIGAGGGFLIVPALMLIAKLPIKKAMATSLLIVSLNSLIGFFLGDMSRNLIEINWDFLIIFTAISFIGILIGGFLSKFINSAKLKQGFAYFIVVMAIFMFIMEFVVHA
ncbi:sulfite exporter TauE/SafE family protein [Moheibacter stercoris]|uniref:Probable membrane transporter protein n=1 Tax=Moheibacter stercoris TaxID=1628251 RepID=A0ABV2LR34_9FLAO